MGRPKKQDPGRPATREEVLAGIRDAIVRAKDAGSFAAEVGALEKLGKSIAMFTDVQKTENPYLAMTSEQFVAEMRDLLWNDDIVREYLRKLLREYDDERGGAPSGLVAVETSETRSLHAVGSPGFVPRGRIN